MAVRTLPATDIASVTAPTTRIAAAMLPMGIRALELASRCGEGTTSSFLMESNRATCVSASASLTLTRPSTASSSGSYE
jgi:hypothetical protein